MRTSRRPWSMRWLWIALCHNVEYAIGASGAVPVGIGEMLIMFRKRTATTFAVVMILVLAAFATAETTRKEMHFKVGHRASISIVNQYGPISVKPGPGKQVVVTAILYSAK